jgi:hypothetical protein
MDALHAQHWSKLIPSIHSSSILAGCTHAAAHRIISAASKCTMQKQLCPISPENHTADTVPLEVLPTHCHLKYWHSSTVSRTAGAVPSRPRTSSRARCSAPEPAWTSRAPCGPIQPINQEFGAPIQPPDALRCPLLLRDMKTMWPNLIPQSICLSVCLSVCPGTICPSPVVMSVCLLSVCLSDRQHRCTPQKVVRQSALSRRQYMRKPSYSIPLE